MGLLYRGVHDITATLCRSLCVHTLVYDESAETDSWQPRNQRPYTWVFCRTSGPHSSPLELPLSSCQAPWQIRSLRRCVCAYCINKLTSLAATTFELFLINSKTTWDVRPSEYIPRKHDSRTTLTSTVHEEEVGNSYSEATLNTA